VIGLSHSEIAPRGFGQHDHARVFGKKDIGLHLGSTLRLKASYSLRDCADDATLEHNIPSSLRFGVNGNPIFVS
jgi:hypothetical protein